VPVPPVHRSARARESALEAQGSVLEPVWAQERVVHLLERAAARARAVRALEPAQARRVQVPAPVVADRVAVPVEEQVAMRAPPAARVRVQVVRVARAVQAARATAPEGRPVPVRQLL
jgi:hypothetical protein